MAPMLIVQGLGILAVIGAVLWWLLCLTDPKWIAERRRQRRG
jgi:hypothetical protein